MNKLFIATSHAQQITKDKKESIPKYFDYSIEGENLYTIDLEKNGTFKAIKQNATHRREDKHNPPTQNQDGLKIIMELKEKNAPRLLKVRPNCCKIKKDALAFGTRMCIILTTSSLFVLIRNPENERGYPSGNWVYVTACIVSWFPALDAASVIKKNIQRMIGTCIGAILGLSFGFVSLLLPEGIAQNVYLGVSLSVVTLIYCISMIQFNLMKDHSYSGMLGLFTFGMALLPFYTDDDPKFINGCFRMLNVLIGCAVGTLGSLMVWPRSTRSIVQSKVMSQIEKAGKSSHAVMHAAHDIFSGRRFPPSLEQILTEKNTAHDAYAEAITDWKSTMAKLPLLRYDPFGDQGDERKDSFRREVSLTLARVFRIQTTVVLLDSIVRSDTVMNFSTEENESFYTIGDLVKNTLTVCDDHQSKHQSSEASTEELLNLLARLQERVNDRIAMSDVDDEARVPSDFKDNLKRQEIRMPATVREQESPLLFLMLVENLIIRSLRLYYCWREYGERHIIYDKIHLDLY